MGAAAVELCRSLDESRGRMTETARAIKARARIPRIAVADPPTPVRPGAGAVDRLLDRMPMPDMDDLEAKAAAATDASHQAQRPGPDPSRSTRRNATLIGVLACAAAGALAGLAARPSSGGNSTDS